jgi:hypothetical protein
VSRLFHGPGYEPADGVLLPTHLVHDLGKRRSVLALEHGDHPGRFTTLARPAALLCFGYLFGFRRVLV